MKNELPQGWAENLPSFPPNKEGLSTREASGKVIQAIHPFLPGLIGGSADLNESTKTALLHSGNFQSATRARGDRQGEETGAWNYRGRNIFYGVREHAMGSISNGLASVKGLIPFTATFLTFSDYMRPPIRLACLMRLHVIYVFTHDSLGLGEDGPTHQPIEQLANLRAIPRLTVIRPADANETAVAWKIAVEAQNHPTALIFTRQKVPIFDRKKYKSANGLGRGAYILADSAKGKPDIILLASGSEVQLIVAAQEKLIAKKYKVRLVSIPSWELFDKQSQRYRDSIISPAVKTRLGVEAGVAQGWERYIGSEGAMISVENYGASAPGEVVMDKYGFNVDHVVKRALALIKKNKRTLK